MNSGFYLDVITTDLAFNHIAQGFPGGSVVKNLPAKAGDVGVTDSIPVSGRSPGEGNGSPLQYSCLENCVGRGAWQVPVHGITSWICLSD